MGVTAEGINREVATILECASLCRPTTCNPLAIPETALYNLASMIPPRHKALCSLPSANGLCTPSMKEMIKGALPSIRHLVHRDSKPDPNREGGEKKKGTKPKKTPKKKGKAKETEVGAILPDTFADPEKRTIDPYGNDYYCTICNQELSNNYFHCKGCEQLLGKDFNVCDTCHETRAYLTNHEMLPNANDILASDCHHYADPNNECNSKRTAGREQHHDYGNCRQCSKCMHCTCKCHAVFERRYRFYTQEQLKEMLKNCEDFVDGKEVVFSRETLSRLDGVHMTATGTTSNLQLPIDYYRRQWNP